MNEPSLFNREALCQWTTPAGVPLLTRKSNGDYLVHPAGCSRDELNRLHAAIADALSSNETE